MKGKFISVPGSYTTDLGTAGLLDTAADRVVFDVQGLDYVEIYLDQITDAGTCSLVVEATIDGVNWAPVATKADTDFGAGANVSIRITDSDTHGMWIPSKQLRVTLSAKTGGTYNAHCAGIQREGYA